MLELVRCDEGAAECDERVGCYSRYSRRGDERGESDGGRKDGAQEQGGETEHDCDCVAGLLVLVDGGDPAGEGEDAVAGYGPDEAG